LGLYAVSEQRECQHVWIFTTPNHIRCTSCPAIGQRWPTRGERAEFKRGGWIYLKPRPATP
jgi:hypothetical protein